MKTIYFISIIFFLSCSPARHSVFKVTPNDVADIELILLKNQTFRMYFKAFDDKPPKKYTFKGIWSENKVSIRLDFKLDKNDLPDIYALFDPALDDSNFIKIIDKNTIEFTKSTSTMVIWGLRCVRIFKDGN